MQLQAIASLDDTRIEIYRDVTDAERLKEWGCCVVEGRANVRCLILRSRLETRSVLVTPTAFEALRDTLAKLPADVPVYVAAPPILSGIAGYPVSRGALAVGALRPDLAVSQLRAPEGQPSLLVALEYLANPENVGGVFRNAAAFGVDGVLLDPRSCDPLYRKAIRVSMGETLCLPFARASAWPEALGSFREAGYTIVGLHPDRLEPGGVELRRLDVAWNLGRRVLLVLGNEGEGLSRETRTAVDRCVRIDMAPGVDSLNVASASAVALHVFGQHAGKGAEG